MDKIEASNENLMRDHIKRLQERLGGQRNMICNLLKANDVDMMTREVNVLEHLHGNLVAAVDKVLKTNLLGTETQLEEMIMEEDTKLFEVKKDVIKWMAVQAEADSRSQVSHSSKHTVMSDNPYGPRRIGTNNEVDSEVQLKDQLWDKLSKLRKQLEVRKNLCKELVIQKKDMAMLRQEIHQLEEIYENAAEIALNLRELLPGKEANQFIKRHKIQICLIPFWILDF